MSEQPLSEEKKLENKTSELEKRNKRRFQIELEFIQCLANPWYLNSLYLFFFPIFFFSLV